MRVLGIFAKQPVPGAVKTRLARQTTPERASAVAAALLTDVLDRTSGVRADRVIAFAPPQALVWFTAVARGRFSLEPQADGDLGRRLAAGATAAVV